MVNKGQKKFIFKIPNRTAFIQAMLMSKNLQAFLKIIMPGPGVTHYLLCLTHTAILPKNPGRFVDNWGWTLGERQYKWFKESIEKSNAKFKFVFCHQLIGGGDTKGRGGAEFVKYYEMGGYNKDNTWGFDVKRPGWEKPIHQLMADNKVTIFFHGHDHFFDKQEFDGVIYQLVPQLSHPNFKNAGQAESYGYITGDILPNSGYLQVTVSEPKVTIYYIRSYLPKDETGQRYNGPVAYSYTIQSK